LENNRNPIWIICKFYFDHTRGYFSRLVHSLRPRWSYGLNDRQVTFPSAPPCRLLAGTAEASAAGHSCQKMTLSCIEILQFGYCKYTDGRLDNTGGYSCPCSPQPVGSAQAQPGSLSAAPGLARPVNRTRAWAVTSARGLAQLGTKLKGRPDVGPMSEPIM